MISVTDALLGVDVFLICLASLAFFAALGVWMQLRDAATGGKK